MSILTLKCFLHCTLTPISKSKRRNSLTICSLYSQVTILMKYMSMELSFSKSILIVTCKIIHQRETNLMNLIKMARRMETKRKSTNINSRGSLIPHKEMLLISIFLSTKTSNSHQTQKLSL